MKGNDALTILQVAYPFAQVSTDAVGGAEQILSRIDLALVQKGHHSLVVACEGSKISGDLIDTPRVNGPIDAPAQRFVHQQCRETIRNCIQQRAPDVIHFHGVDCYSYLPQTAIPSLLTLHCPLAFYDPELLKNLRPNFFIHCVSGSQRRSCPPEIRLLPDIPNGVAEFSSHRPLPKANFAISLGRICPEKNFHVAIDAAKAARTSLLLAGTTFRYSTHETYFKTEILPRLDPRRRYIGPIAGERKWNLLSTARCLLIPSIAQETSSLVAMEALTCGTPVIAFPTGALPEIIDHGTTGFIVQDLNEMVEAIAMSETISPDNCRKAAKDRFSADRMTAQYIDVYEKMARADKHLTPDIAA